MLLIDAQCNMNKNDVNQILMEVFCASTAELAQCGLQQLERLGG